VLATNANEDTCSREDRLALRMPVHILILGTAERALKVLISYDILVSRRGNFTLLLEDPVVFDIPYDTEPVFSAPREASLCYTDTGSTLTQPEHSYNSNAFFTEGIWTFRVGVGGSKARY